VVGKLVDNSHNTVVVVVVVVVIGGGSSGGSGPINIYIHYTHIDKEKKL